MKITLFDLIMLSLLCGTILFLSITAPQILMGIVYALVFMGIIWLIFLGLIAAGKMVIYDDESEGYDI